jgi:hypothetical protein
MLAIRALKCIIAVMFVVSTAQAEIISQDFFEGATVNSTIWISQAQPWTPAHLLPVITTAEHYGGNSSMFCETYAYEDNGERSEVIPSSAQHW